MFEVDLTTRAFPGTTPADVSPTLPVSWRDLYFAYNIPLDSARCVLMSSLSMSQLIIDYGDSRRYHFNKNAYFSNFTGFLGNFGL